MKPDYSEAAEAIPPLVDEYMRLLGLHGDGPIVEVKDNIGSKWLGRTTIKGHEIWVEVQASTTEDPETLEKIIAHEMAHYAELATLDESDLALLRHGIGDVEHGEKFWRFANIINEAKGQNYVTEQSDASYELAENTRPFFMVIGQETRGPVKGRFWWRWAAKRTPAIDAKIQKLVEDDAVLVESTDGQFLSGAKLGKGKIGSSMAKEGSDNEAALREIFEEAKEDHGI